MFCASSYYIIIAEALKYHDHEGVKERAKGSVCLIIMENASVDSPQGSNGTTQLRIDHDDYIPRLFKFCENIHRYGTCVAVQINHAGASARTDMQTVGFDAVEIHAGHSYLISQFLSPLTNRWTDEFGGSLENRTHFCRMVIDEVRRRVGPAFPILLRIRNADLIGVLLFVEAFFLRPLDDVLHLCHFHAVFFRISKMS